jgi:hypothetical protein
VAIPINSEEYNKMTKAELIMLIQNLKEQIEYYENREEDQEERFE